MLHASEQVCWVLTYSLQWTWAHSWTVCLSSLQKFVKTQHSSVKLNVFQVQVWYWGTKWNVVVRYFCRIKVCCFAQLLRVPNGTTPLNHGAPCIIIELYNSIYGPQWSSIIQSMRLHTNYGTPLWLTVTGEFPAQRPVKRIGLDWIAFV